MEKLTEKQVGYVEGYAKALNDVMHDLSGDPHIAKSCDPVRIEGDYIYSYAFDMKDGNLKHPLSDYYDVDEITSVIFKEAITFIREEL